MFYKLHNSCFLSRSVSHPSILTMASQEAEVSEGNAKLVEGGSFLNGGGEGESGVGSNYTPRKLKANGVGVDLDLQDSMAVDQVSSH